MSYETLAGLYDGLMQDVDYDAWAERIHSLLTAYQCPGKTIVDLGCGTGNITLPLARMGYRMMGVDLSDRMIAQAREKDTDHVVQWICDDISEFYTENQVDAMIATFDVLNHLTESEQLQSCFLQVADGLADGGLFLFDVRTPAYLRETLGNQIYVHHGASVDYIWENQFDEESQICDMYLTYFVRREDGVYEKYTETQQERSYDLELLRLWLDFAGMTVLDVQEEEGRAFFISQKKRWDADCDEEDCLF